MFVVNISSVIFSQLLYTNHHPLSIGGLASQLSRELKPGVVAPPNIPLG